MQSDMSLVSVIVPVYMVEEYLQSCVDSVINQTYRNLEIILVNDGSSDNCGKICDDYALLDKRIKVIHKKNGGLSDARNAGIKIAEGEYITCVDSDDFIAEDMVENLYKVLTSTKADIAVCGMIKTSDRFPSIQNDNVEKIEEFTPQEAIEEGLYNRKFPLSAWAKLYRKSLFKEIEYPVGKLYEDLFTTYKLILKSTKIVFTSRVGYYYFYRTGSIVATKFKINHLDCFEALEKMRQEGIFTDAKLVSAYESAMVEAYTELLEKNPPLKEKAIRILWKQVKKYRINTILNVNSSKRVRGKAALLLLGNRFSQIIIKAYYKMKWKF